MLTRTPRGVIRKSDYAFVDDKHEIIYIMMRLVQLEAAASSRPISVVISQAAAKAGITPATPRGWFSGKTRRPFFDTVERFLHALGVSLVPPELHAHAGRGKGAVRARVEDAVNRRKA